MPVIVQQPGGVCVIIPLVQRRQHKPLSEPMVTGGMEMRSMVLCGILMATCSLAATADTCELTSEGATVWEVADYLYDEMDHFRTQGILPDEIVFKYCPPNLTNRERDFLLRWLEFNWYTLPVKEDVQLLGDTTTKYRAAV